MVYIIIDIETIAHPDAHQWLDPVTPDKRLKDPEKVKADIEEKTAARDAMLALDPDTNQIVALGYYVVNQSGDPFCCVMKDEFEEREHLKAFGALYQALDKRQEVRLVTYNGMHFDLPTMLRRASLLEADFPDIDIDKYRSPHAKYDVMWRLTFKGLLKMKSLKFYVKRYNLPLLDRVNGKEIAQLVKDDNWDAVEAHCLSDVGLTHALANRLGMLTV